MSKTIDNLKEAFAGESQANQRYRAFAKKAERDGFPNVAKLFRTTADNLRGAIGGETYEYTEMYPPMLAAAARDGHKAKRMFAYAVKAEEVHARLYTLALEAVARGVDLDVTDFFLCTVCGHIELGTPPEGCPICGANAKAFTRVDPML